MCAEPGDSLPLLLLYCSPQQRGSGPDPLLPGHGVRVGPGEGGDKDLNMIRINEDNHSCVNIN